MQIALNNKLLKGKEADLPTPSKPLTVFELETPRFKFGEAVVGHDQVVVRSAYFHSGFKFMKAKNGDWWRFRVAFLGFGLGLYRQIKKSSW